MIDMTTKTSATSTLLLLLLGVGSAPACGGDDGKGDELGSDTTGETSSGDSSTSSSESSGSTSDSGDSTSETGEDPNIACESSWDAVQQKTNGQTHAGYGVAVADDGNFAVVGKLENMDDDAWVGVFSPSGEPIWDEVISSGQGKDYAQAVTFDAGGDLVLVGSLANTNKDLWVEKRSVGDGAILWTVVEPSEFAGDNIPADIDLAPDGSIVVSATIRTGDKDSDIGLRKLASADGSLVWATTYSGSPDANGYSIDRAGPVGVAADGSIYVGGEEGVDAMTKEGVLLQFGAGGGSNQWRLAPREDGSTHLHDVVGVAGGADGEVYFVVHQGADPSPFWFYRAAGDGSIEWELTREDFEFPPTSGWIVSGLDLADDGSVTIGGRLTNEEVGQAIDWSEAWIANIRLDGVGTCIAHHTWKNTHIIPASTFAYGFAEGPNGVVLAGEVVDGPENYLWVGGFD